MRLKNLDNPIKQKNSRGLIDVYRENHEHME